MGKVDFQNDEIGRKYENMLLELRKRPGAYLGDNDINKFGHFLNGIDIALKICEIDYKPIKQRDFTRWLSRKYVNSDSIGWCTLIQKYEKDSSIEKFFELYEKYILECNNRIGDEEVENFLLSQIPELNSLKNEIRKFKESIFEEMDDNAFRIEITDYPCIESKNKFYRDYYDAKILISSEPYVKSEWHGITKPQCIWSRVLVHKNLTDIYVENSVWSKTKYMSLSVWREKRNAAKPLLEEFNDFTIAKKVELDEIQVYWIRRENQK